MTSLNTSMRIDNSQDVLKVTMADVSLFSQMNTKYMFSEMEKHCSTLVPSSIT